MHYVMDTCIILHNIMVSNHDGLEDEIGSDVRGSGASRVRDDGIPHAFLRDAASEQAPPPLRIAAMCTLCMVHRNALEYQRTRELVMGHLS